MQAQNMTVKLWDNTTAPHSNSLTGPEKDEGEVRISNTTEAALYIYEAAADKATGQAIVICPGGGYWLLAMGHEGHDLAKWLAENGITAAVLKYRMPKGNVHVPMEDAAEAIRYMNGDDLVSRVSRQVVTWPHQLAQERWRPMVTQVCALSYDPTLWFSSTP